MSTLGEDLAAAMAEVEGTEEPEEVVSEETVSETLEIETDPVEDPIEAVVEPVEDPKPVEAAEPVVTATPAADDSGTESTKAPVGWSPKLRESWSKVPAEVQAQIRSREADMDKTMADNAMSRHVHGQMSHLATKYGALMSTEGVSDPVVAAEGMFDTVARLQMGTPQQKAATMAGMIKHYGIDIEALDGALVGTAPAANPANAEIERMVEERMRPINQYLQQQQEHAGTQSRESANQEVQEFAKTAEFMYDAKVRNDMADFVDLASARGEKMPIQEAYQKALATNPEILRILEGRQITTNNASVASKKKAASSIVGRKAGTGEGGNFSLRDTLASAWGEAS